MNLLSGPYRLSNGTLYRPTRIEPVKDKSGLASQSFFPSRNAERFSVKGNESIRPSVSGLLLVCFPCTISRFVITSIIKPFYGMCRRWFLAHVYFKITEIKPPVANPYPAATVIFPIKRVGVRASRHHCAPATVFTRKALSMFGVSHCNAIRLKTTAGLCCSIRESFCFHDCRISTVATANPAIPKDSTLVHFPSNRFRNEATESHSKKVLKVLVRRGVAGNYIRRIDVVTHIGLARADALLGFRPLRFNGSLIGG